MVAEFTSSWVLHGHGAIADADTYKFETWRDYGGSGAVRLSQTGNWTVFKDFFADPTLGAYYRDQTRKSLGRNEPNTTTDSASGGAVTTRYTVAKNGMVVQDDTTLLSLYGYRYIYDAWNRLVKTQSQPSTGVVVTEYRYNGLGHRIGWKARFNTGLTYANNLWRYFQYNEKWQQVGMYLGTSSASGAVSSNPIELYLYDSAGIDGRGGSSYIDRTIFRDRDVNGLGSGGDGTLEETRYYLQNWRNDVVELITTTGDIVERYVYDAYGRPSCYSPGDIATSGGARDGPDGTLDGDDSTEFSAVWNGGAGALGWKTDLGRSGGLGGPDGLVDNNDSIAFNSYRFSGYAGGYGLMSAAAVDNRKGFAGYEFDPVLNGTIASGGFLPVYHVRNRVLNCDTGKWIQRDPFGYHDSMDLYEYCQSDPLDKEDAMGLLSSTICLGGKCSAGAVSGDRLAKRCIPARKYANIGK